MKRVEYKLEDGKVFKVPYNRLDVAPISKNCLEGLINTVNASMRQAKILEHIKTNYAYKMREQYDKGKADAIEDYKQSDEYIRECVQRYLKGKKDGQAEAITDFAKWEDDNNINYHEFDNHEDVVKRYLAMKEDK